MHNNMHTYTHSNVQNLSKSVQHISGDGYRGEERFIWLLVREFWVSFSVSAERRDSGRERGAWGRGVSHQDPPHHCDRTVGWMNDF